MRLCVLLKLQLVSRHQVVLHLLQALQHGLLIGNTGGVQRGQCIGLHRFALTAVKHFQSHARAHGPQQIGRAEQRGQALAAVARGGGKTEGREKRRLRRTRIGLRREDALLGSAHIRAALQ